MKYLFLKSVLLFRIRYKVYGYFWVFYELCDIIIDGSVYCLVCIVDCVDF